MKIKHELKSKGVHIFSFCKAETEEALNLSNQCEKVRVKRMQAILAKNKEVTPYQLRLHELNVKLAIIDPNSQKKGALELEQAQVLESIQAVSGRSVRELKGLWEEYRFYVEKLEKKFKTREKILYNVTTTSGRSVLAQRLGGDTSFTGSVNYTALGSDNTAAVVADATLGTETYRKALTSGADLSNVSYLETFFTAAEVNGTFEEYGMFIDGGAGADTGQLFNRFVQTVVKSAVETLNVQSIITFNDA